MAEMKFNNGEPMRGKNLSDAPPLHAVTPDTLLCNGGSAALRLVFAATADIENLSTELLQQVDEVDVNVEALQPCAVIRALGLRILRLNSMVMSFATDDTVTLKDAFREVYGPSSHNVMANELTLVSAGAA